MAQDQVVGWLCPTCGRRGHVVKRAPVIERVCVNNHRWADRPCQVQGYVPLSVRLERVVACLESSLSALQQAETMIKDCASFLTPGQKAKLSVHYELHQIELAKAQIQEAIETFGVKS